MWWLQNLRPSTEPSAWRRSDGGAATALFVHRRDGCDAVAASFASGSRGGWLAIPVFITIFIHFRSAGMSLKTLATSAIAALLVVTVAYFGSSSFHQRVNEFANDVSVFDSGNRETSTGIRWQLYKAAADVFSRHPVFGVGPQGFAMEMQPMMEAGKLTPAAAELGRGEVHNDILSKAAGMGGCSA